MSIDFFNTSCAEAPQATKEFGLCDDQNSRKAYSNVDDSSKWIAIVKNENKIRVQFTPIDNCMNIKKNGLNELESTCDGMLTFENSIYLVELKNSRTRGWRSKSIKQLENTISLIKKNHSIDHLENRKAFASNKKRQVFRESNSSQSKEFLTTTGFTLHEQTEIIIG